MNEDTQKQPMRGEQDVQELPRGFRDAGQFLPVMRWSAGA
jgi:hypothetical protein